MIKSENIDKLAGAMSKLTEEIKNPKNTANNPFYKSKYTPLNDVLDLIRPLLAKNGLSFSQSPVSMQGDGGVLVGVEGLLTHASGQWVVYAPFFFPLNKGTAQDAGSCITYARRYQLTSVFGIMGDDDDDANNVSGKTAAPVKLICSKCKKAITPKGRTTAQQIADGTVEKYGVQLCSDCALDKKI